MSDFSIFIIVLAIVLAGVEIVFWVIFKKTILRIAFISYTFLVALGVAAGYSVAHYGLKVIWIAVLFMLIFVFINSVIILRVVKRPINGLVAGMDRLANTADFTERAPKSFTQRNDEIGQLANALENIVVETQKTLQESKRSSHELMNASKLFMKQSNIISTGANDQSASTEEISTSMEEMVSNINHNLDNANQSANLGQQVINEVAAVSEAFNLTSKTMENIRQKTVNIGEVARKINVLAINAAIEAARAGEYGRGFAVVAAEVRNLADQSQKASAEIDGISLESTKAVEEMGLKLDTAVPNIKKTITLINEIAAASNEQRQGAEQINTALNQLVQTTNENSSISEELSTGAEQLVELANNMEQSLANFTI
ncbi:MAG TPA: methyl-accepting chemotaxis protein [Salinivirgaceae bacterium]|nr:methyl-accepting chemotaxis protein [Salinivirgaceae bacterium]